MVQCCVHNCTNSTFEYEIGIKFNDTILSYFENPDVATNIFQII